MAQWNQPKVSISEHGATEHWTNMSVTILAQKHVPTDGKWYQEMDTESGATGQRTRSQKCSPNVFERLGTLTDATLLS